MGFANLSAWLLALAWPVVKKVLVALGIGVATYAGLQVIGAQIESSVLGAWGQIGGTTLQIATLGGVPEAIGIILGGFNARIAMVAYGKIGRIATA